MQSLAASLPEYPVVMEMFGVGPTLGPQLMAEIGDVRRFHSKKALVAFAGIDAVKNNRFVVLEYVEVTPGPRNIKAVEKLVAGFAAQ